VVRVARVEERDRVQQAGSRVGHRGGGDPDRVDVAARQAAAGDRLAELGVPQDGAGALVEGVDRVALAGDQHAAAHHQRLAVHRLVERDRGPARLRAPQGRAAAGDARAGRVALVGGPVGRAGERHRVDLGRHRRGGRRPVGDVEQLAAHLVGGPTGEPARQAQRHQAGDDHQEGSGQQPAAPAPARSAGDAVPVGPGTRSVVHRTTHRRSGRASTTATLVISAKEPGEPRARAAATTPLACLRAAKRRKRPHRRCCAAHARATTAGSRPYWRRASFTPTEGRCW
jgi:hypothetical protein